jgi:hypothetical protein
MNTSKNCNLSVKEKYDVCFGIVQMILIVATIIFAFKAYQQTNNIFKSQNQPNIIVTESSADKDGNIMLWNMGPGVAYDINVETHFADNIGNVGVSWIKEVIESAIELETKSENEIFINQNTSSLGTTNPPNILPVGLDYGYKSKNLLFHPLSGLIIIVRYKDNIGNLYYSYWNGYNWSYSSGSFKTPPPKFRHLHPSNPVEQFIAMLKTYKLENYSDYSKLNDRLLKEAKYLQENGYDLQLNK